VYDPPIPATVLDHDALLAAVRRKIDTRQRLTPIERLQILRANAGAQATLTSIVRDA
jgi:hypothetical protein